MLRWSLLLLLAPLDGFGQEGPIETDRPDQTETAATVPAGWFQLEAGTLRASGTESRSDWSLPTGLLKVGLNDHFELRCETERTRRKVGEADAVENYGPLELGLKTALCAEKGWTPRTSFLLHVGVPGSGSGEERAEHASCNFRFIADHSLGERWSIAANAGLEWDGGSLLVNSIYTLTTAYRFADRWGCYAEVYGDLPEDAPAHNRWDGGFTWLLNDDVQLDTSGGHSFQTDGWFVSVGVSLRVRAWRTGG